MRDLAQEFRGVPLLLERISLVGPADDLDLARDNFPRLALSLRSNELAADDDGGARLQSLDVRVIWQRVFGNDLKTPQARTVVQLDERKILRVPAGPHPALDLHTRNRRGAGER